MKTRSLVDQDSDRWVFEVLAPHLRRKMKSLKASTQWTDLVYIPRIVFKKILREFTIIFSAQSLKELHREGKTKDDIIGALEILPFVRLLYSIFFQNNLLTT